MQHRLTVGLVGRLSMVESRRRYLL